MQYKFKLWEGEPDVGLLLARPVVNAESSMEAIEKAIKQLSPLIRDADVKQFSIRITRE